MLRAKKERRFFIISMAVYLAAVILFSIVQYFHSKQSLLSDLDRKLYIVATAANNFLRYEMRHNIAGARRLSFDEDYLIALNLQTLADDFFIEYIYTMAMHDGQVVFLTSNMSPEERESASYNPVSFTLYTDAPLAVYDAIGYNKPQFSQYEDRWGSFRSLFVPYLGPNNMPYVVGVDVDIRTVHVLALKSLAKAIAYGLLLGLVAFPIIFLYSRLFKRYYLEKIKASENHPVTGLPNNRCLMNKIQRSTSAVQHLLLIKIENFHDIGNLNGLAFGDQLLLRIHYCLSDISNQGAEHCELYHLDESLFGIYTQKVLTRQQQIDVVGESFNRLTKMKVSAGDGRVAPLALRLATASDSGDVYTLARMALSYAAENNKTFIEYHPTLKLPEYFQRYLDIYHALNEGVENNRIKVFFQPIVDALTGEAVKYEALIRLLDKDHQVIFSPEDFMPVAYQSRLCHKLSRLVLSEVIDVLKDKTKVVSINLSVKDLFDQTTREYLIKKIREENVGARLEFELLEQQSISNYKRAAAYIRQLKSCVSAVGIDDLGKLYSNFDRLLNLPIDFVKIDGVLIESLANNEESRSIVSGIVRFAEQKGINTIAEYCSSPEVCQKVTQMRIQLLQGFYLCEPKASIDEADAQLARSHFQDIHYQSHVS